MAQKKAVFPTVFHHVSWNFLCHVVWGFPSWYPCGPIFKTNWAIEHVTLNCLRSSLFGVFRVKHVATRPDRKHPLAVWITLWEVHLFEIKERVNWRGPITWSASLRDEGCRSLQSSSSFPPPPHGHTYYLPVTIPHAREWWPVMLGCLYQCWQMCVVPLLGGLSKWRSRSRLQWVSRRWRLP